MLLDDFDISVSLCAGDLTVTATREGLVIRVLTLLYNFSNPTVLQIRETVGRGRGEYKEVSLRSFSKEDATRLSEYENALVRLFQGEMQEQRKLLGKKVVQKGS